MRRITLFAAAAIAAISIGAAAPTILALEKGGQRAVPRAPAPQAQERRPPANPPSGGDRAAPRQPQTTPRAVPREAPRERPDVRLRYEPHMWAPFYYGVPYVPWYYPWGYPYPPYGYAYPITPYGSVRLEIDQRQASVLVDGFYVGIVDDFDGVFQRLNLKVGGHRIQIDSPGYETLTFDVYIQAGRTITFRQTMVPILP